ncbi:MAG: right-handed parallel beta-helix repeat-containing protein [Burkholderiaceae bacterium]
MGWSHCLGNPITAPVFMGLARSVVTTGLLTVAMPHAQAGSETRSGTSLLPGPGTGTTEQICTLTLVKTPVTITGSHKTVENLRIESTTGTALTVSDATDIEIRNLHIRHANGRGIAILNSKRIVIRNIIIESTDAPTNGPHRKDTNENIFTYQSELVQVNNARLYRGSSGIYMLESDNARLSGIYGEDFRGPYPRGQFVQFDNSHNAVLTDFHTISFPKSWPEDNINIYQSENAVIKLGVIDGNNAPNGVGIMFDGGTASGRVEDVDAIRMGNGSFSAYDGTNDATFIRTRSRDDICTDQGRGKPSSGGTIWTGNPRLNGLTVTDSTFDNPCFQVVWPRSAFKTLQIKQEAFAMRSVNRPSMCWENS